MSIGLSVLVDGPTRGRAAANLALSSSGTDVASLEDELSSEGCMTSSMAISGVDERRVGSSCVGEATESRLGVRS
jgi:hypothetical protein